MGSPEYLKNDRNRILGVPAWRSTSSYSTPPSFRTQKLVCRQHNISISKSLSTVQMTGLECEKKPSSHSDPSPHILPTFPFHIRTQGKCAAGWTSTPRRHPKSSSETRVRWSAEPGFAGLCQLRPQSLYIMSLF